MRRPHVLAAAGLALLFLLPTREGRAAAPLAGVRLTLAAKAQVGVGDDLGVSLAVINDGPAKITVVRPLEGSWEGLREPRLSLQWFDAAGQVVPDPLGFAPGLDCGTVASMRADDLVTIPPGAQAALPAGPDAAARHRVATTARPGRYTVRAHYRVTAVPGAAALELVSNAVPVEITSGDAALWACRAQQLRDETNHEQAELSPVALVPARGGGAWLLTTRRATRTTAGQRATSSELWLTHVSDALVPQGAPWLVRREAGELGFVSAVSAADDRGDGLVVTMTPGAVGARRVETMRIDLTATGPAARPAQLVQDAPGNPYVTELVRAGDRLYLAHAGPRDGQLVLSVLDLDGRVVAKPVTLAAAGVTQFDLEAEATQAVAVWLVRGVQAGGVVQRLDRNGQPAGAAARFPLDPSMQLAGAGVDGTTLRLAYADASTRGDDPTDRMGLYELVLGGALDASTSGITLTRRALSPESTTEHHFGVAAWRRAAQVRAFIGGTTLRVGAGAGKTQVLSTHAPGGLVLTPYEDGFVALWTDTADDRSRACLELGRCVTEAYAARLGANGRVTAQPRRLTATARPAAFVASPWDWQKTCRP